LGGEAVFHSALRRNGANIHGTVNENPVSFKQVLEFFPGYREFFEESVE
jgi:hypothetical protein